MSLSLSREGEEIPGEGAASCCSLPAGTDRPPLSACLQISYRDVICLAAWLNAHLLTRLRLCVIECVCVLTSAVPSQLEWHLPLYLPPCDYRRVHTQNDRWIFTTLMRYLCPLTRHAADAFPNMCFSSTDEKTDKRLFTSTYHSISIIMFKLYFKLQL